MGAASPIRGTPGYLPPEMVWHIADGTIQATPEHDLWSFGVLIYILMSGKGTPFGDIQDEIIAASDQPTRIRKYVEFTTMIADLISELKNPTCTIKPPFNEIIAGLLEPDPQKRMTDTQLAQKLRIDISQQR